MSIKMLILLFSNFVMGISGQQMAGFNVVITPSTNIISKVGENIVLRCTGTLPSTASFMSPEWGKADSDGNQVGEAISRNDGKDPLTTTLELTDVNGNDTGYYVCKMVISDLRTIGTIKNTTKLTVYNLEVPIMWPTMISIGEKETAIFTCPKPSGTTPIHIIWIKDGGVLNVSDTGNYPYQHHETSLIISNVRESDEGVYQCRAENAAYTGDEGQLSNNGSLSVISPTSTSILNNTIRPECTGPTSIFAGIMVFTGILIGVVLYTIILCICGKIKSAKTQALKEIPLETQSKDYMTYNGDPEDTYDDVDLEEKNAGTHVYVNVKTKKGR